jgi:hypothetical protein
MNDKNVKISINNTGLMADSASVNFRYPIRPVYNVGKVGVFNRVMDGGSTTEISLNYISEVYRDPNFGILNYVKNTNSNDYDKFIVCVGGISGISVLESLSFTLAVNEPLSVSAGYVSYQPTSGTLREQTNNNYNPSGTSGIAHSWTTKFYNGTNLITTGNFYSLSYQYRANWNPIYTIGNTYPIQIDFNSAEETIEVVRDFYKSAHPSGFDSESFLGIDKLRIYGLSEINTVGNAYIELNLSSGYVINNQVNATSDDIIRITSTVQRVF